MLLHILINQNFEGLNAPKMLVFGTEPVFGAKKMSRVFPIIWGCMRPLLSWPYLPVHPKPQKRVIEMLTNMVLAFKRESKQYYWFSGARLTPYKNDSFSVQKTAKNEQILNFLETIQKCSSYPENIILTHFGLKISLSKWIFGKRPNLGPQSTT